MIEFVNGKDYIIFIYPIYEMENNPVMFETTSISSPVFHHHQPVIHPFFLNKKMTISLFASGAYCM
jgi:hypothetical protein